MNKFLLFILFFSFQFCFSQQAEKEFWSKMEYGFKLNKKSSLSLESGARYSLNPYIFTKQFLDFSSSFKINKILSLDNGIRVTKIPNQKNLGRRLYFSLYIKPDLKKIKISLRSRIFSEKNVVSYHRQYFRNKLAFGYRINKRISPYIEAEHLMGINNNSENKFRYGLGSQFSFSKSIALKLFYRIQNTNKKIIGVYISKKI